MKSTSKIIILLLIVVALAIIPMLIHKDAEFGGADGEGMDLIGEINPSYEPWHEPFWEPPSGEIESLLFSIQVAIGAGLVGYGLGILRERKKLASNR